MAEMDIHRNDRVMTADGMEMGHVTHVIVDGPTREVTDIVVDQDGHEWLVPISAVMQNSGNTLTVRATGADVASGAGFNRSEYHAVDDDMINEEGHGTAMPGAATLDHADRNDAVIDDERGMAGRTRGGERLARRETGRDYSKDDRNISVPVVEEQLKAGVRETEGGKARITKNVVEEQKTIDVPVEREEVYVTERAVNRVATQEDLNMRDRDIEIPLREQEVVTQKEARVVGEVNIRKEVKHDTERVTDTVRREEVHVEDSSNPRVHVEGERGMTGRTGDRSTGDASGKTVTDRRHYDAQGNLTSETEKVEGDGGRKA